MRWLLSLIDPFDNRDQFSRYANFIKVANQKSPEVMFELARGRYPRDTRFVVLLMDMAIRGFTHTNHQLLNL